MQYRVFYYAFLLAAILVNGACSGSTSAGGDGIAGASQQVPSPTAAVVTTNLSPSPTPRIFPDLQAALLDGRHASSDSPIAAFDFKNYTYPLPRGWQNPDGTDEITLKNGRVQRVEPATTDDMDSEAKAEARVRRRIGMSYLTTKYLDITGDGSDEAIVVLKVETGGAAIPQLGYVFTWKGDQPQLIWSFRTGDRADGGLKDLRSENGEFVLELYGQDRFLLGGIETGKITGDEEQLCCPTFFTRSRYKWNGNTFLMQGKRLTYSIAEPASPPQENLGDKVNAPAGRKK